MSSAKSHLYMSHWVGLTAKRVQIRFNQKICKINPYKHNFRSAWTLKVQNQVKLALRVKNLGQIQVELVGFI